MCLKLLFVSFRLENQQTRTIIIKYLRSLFFSHINNSKFSSLFVVRYISFTVIHHHRQRCHKPSPLCCYVPSRFVAFFLSTQTEATHASKNHLKLFAHTSCKYLASNRSHILCAMQAFVVRLYCCYRTPERSEFLHIAQKSYANSRPPPRLHRLND